MKDHFGCNKLITVVETGVGGRRVGRMKMSHGNNSEMARYQCIAAIKWLWCRSYSRLLYVFVTVYAFILRKPLENEEMLGCWSLSCKLVLKMDCCVAVRKWDPSPGNVAQFSFALCVLCLLNGGSTQLGHGGTLLTGSSSHYSDHFVTKLNPIVLLQYLNYYYLFLVAEIVSSPLVSVYLIITAKYFLE